MPHPFDTETLPAVADAITLAAGRLARATTEEERRQIHRAHLASVAGHLATALFSAADQAGTPSPLDGEFMVAEIAPRLYAAHALGGSALSDAECREVAVQAYLDRLHELSVGGAPWGRNAG